MAQKSKQLTAELIELRNAIKRKYKAFKEGVEENDIMLEKQYKPIIKELRKTHRDIKIEPKEEEEEEMKEEPMEYESAEEEFEPRMVSTPRGHTLTELVSTPDELETVSQYVEQHFENPLTKKYMKMLMGHAGGRTRLIDHDFGPRYDTQGNTLMVGNKPLEFDTDGSILIAGTRYRPTEGLYELLFKRLPSEDIYTSDDLATYKNILMATNAHKWGNKYHSKIKRDGSLKYRHVIKELFPEKSGSGMAWKSANSRDIIHWDDANELIERLQHIVMSTETGNRVHSNEIISIMEELREAGFIKGAGNSRFKALLK